MRIRVKYAETFDTLLCEDTKELGIIFNLVIKAKQRKAKMEIKNRKLNKMSDSHHSINYQGLYNYLEQYKSLTV